jgi:hypothetical protein
VRGSWWLAALLAVLLASGCTASDAAFTDVARAPQSLSAADSWPSDAPARLRVQSRRYESNDRDGLIHVGLLVVNDGLSPVDLSTVTVRYWFSGDGATGSFIAECYYALLGCAPGGPVQPVIGEPVPSRQDGDRYIEVRYTGGSLSPGGDTGDTQVATRTSTGAALDERNDYSRSRGTRYEDAENVTAYDNGVLVWGTEPEVLTARDEVEVRYANLDQGEVPSSINPGLDIRNVGTLPIDLARVTVRYWFSRDGAVAMSTWCDYAAITCANVVRTTRLAVPLRRDGDTILEVGFVTGQLSVGASTGQILLRMSKSTYADLNERNDYSYDKRANYDLWSHVTAYIDGRLVFGDEPRAMTAEEIAALFPTTTTTSSTTTTTIPEIEQPIAPSTSGVPTQPIAPSTTVAPAQPIAPSTTVTPEQPIAPSTTAAPEQPIAPTTTAAPAPEPTPLIRPGPS